jgi:MFS family permease
LDHVKAPRLAPPQISPGTILLLAAACGLIVANIYYAQPLIGPISQSLGLAPQAAGLIVTMSQIGYGAGLMFIVPLGDLVENRRLVLASVALSAVCARRCGVRAFRRGVSRLRRRDRPGLGGGADPGAAGRASRARCDARAGRRDGVERGS